MALSLIQTGERGTATILNRSWREILTASGFANDGSDFDGFQRKRLFDVRSYGATGDGTTDDTTALQDARAAAQAANGVLYAPRGVYRYSAMPFDISDRMAILGDGPRHTIFKPLSSYSGYCIRLSDMVRDPGEDHYSATTIDYTTSNAGALFQGFAIVGDRTYAARGIQMRGGVDHADFTDVKLAYLKGKALEIGVEAIDGEAFMRESAFTRLRISNCGSDTEPFLHIATQSDGGGDGTNQLTFLASWFVYNYEGGLIECTGGAATNGKNTRRIMFTDVMWHGRGQASWDGLWVDGVGSSPLLTIKGRVLEVRATGLRLNGSHYVSSTAYPLVQFEADATNTYYPQDCTLDVSLRNSQGEGIRIKKGNNLRFTGTVDPSVITGGYDLIAEANSIPTAIYDDLRLNSGSRNRSIDSTVTARVFSTLTSADGGLSDGYRQTFDGFYYDNVAAGLAATTMSRLPAGASPTTWIAPRPGSVTGVAAWANAAITADYIYVKVEKSTDNGGSWSVMTDSSSGQQLSAALDTTNTRFHRKIVSKDAATFNQGDHLRLRIESGASLTPAGSVDVRGILEVET